MLNNHVTKHLSITAYNCHITLDNLLPKYKTHRIVSKLLYQLSQCLLLLTCLSCHLCCCVEDTDRCKYVFFSISKYNENCDAVNRALCYRFSRPQMREMICRKCHNCLKKLVMPPDAVSSPVKVTRCNAMQCIICYVHLVSGIHIFRHSRYDVNPALDTALDASHVTESSVICQKCHTKFTRSSMYSCIMCRSLTQRRNTVPFDPTDLTTRSIDIALEDGTYGNRHVCKTCYTRVKYGVYTCFICCRDVEKQVALDYCPAHYDFNSFIVLRCVPCHREDTEKKYICKDCHSSLALCTDEKPVVPKYVDNPILHSAASFLKSLSDHP